ncbi:HNH endonuclease [bacterium]|nr:HNH endonuclease [bacterium]
MSIYRRLYEQAYGPIPKDSSGRSYEIHHIDGNRKNNDLSNLRCVSIQEHYDIHFAQGDWAACHRIATKMKLDPKTVSEMSKRNVRNMIENGTHPFVGGEHHRKLAREGRHSAQIRSALGINPFQDSEWKRQNAIKLVEEGRHPSQSKKECPHCKGLFSITGYKRHVSICEHNPYKVKNKYKAPEKKQCPYCMGYYDPGNYKKHHGENCKNKEEVKNGFIQPVHI